MKSRTVLIILPFLLLASFLFVKPIFDNGLYTLGDGIDHDVTYMFSGGFLNSLKVGQIPFWNPWYCGGNVLFAYPHMELLSPLSLLMWIFGGVLGLKLRIFLAVFAALTGAYFLSREFGLGRYSSLIPAFIFALNGSTSLTQAAGQSWRLAFAFFPWILLFYLRTITNKDNIIRNYILFVILIVFQYMDNTSYYFMYSLLFIGILTLIYTYTQRSLKPIKILGITLLLVMGLSAVRMIPMGMVYQEIPRTIERFNPSDGISMSNLLKSLTFAPHNEPNWEWYFRLAPEMEMWYEYAYYIGWFILLCAIIGLPLLWKKQKILFLTGIFFFIYSLGIHSIIPVFKFVNLFPVFSSQHMPTRAFIYVMLLLGLSAGYVFSFFEKKRLLIKIFKEKINISKIILFVGIFLTAFILISTNSKPFEKQFKLELNEEIDQPFKMISSYKNFNWNFKNYQHLRENEGVIQCNVEPLHPTWGAIPAYYIVETDYIKANFNHRQVFVFDNGKINTYWLTGNAINDLYQLPFTSNDKSTQIIFLIPDQENKFSSHFPLTGTQSRLVLPTWNMIKIELQFNDQKKIFSREDINFSKIKETSFDFAMNRNDEKTSLIQTAQFFMIIPSDKSLPETASGKITFTELDRPFNIRPNPEYRGEAFLYNKTGKTEIIKFTPNEVSVKVEGLQGNNTLVLNQNYFKGWYEKNSKIKAINIENKIGLPISKDGVYTFKYRAPGFIAGTILSIVTLILIFLLIRLNWLKKILS